MKKILFKSLKEAPISNLDVNKGPGKLCKTLCRWVEITSFTHFKFITFYRHFSIQIKWKDSFLIPIFKTGKPNVFGNYRGVAILSCFVNLFEATVYDYIFISVKSSVMSAQQGFFKGKSTVTNLIELTSYVLNCMNGVHVPAGRRNYILISQRRRVIRRPLGLSFGAFILFINDVFSSFKSLLLYADDLKICFPVAGNSDFANAQAELDVFFQWCTDSGMQLNLGKCKSISFTRSRLTRHFQHQQR
jgi:hypothetical protein